jgi:hypothetical protein
MAIDFPDSPAENDSFTSGGKKWIFNGTVWSLITANSYTISTGEVTTAKIANNAVTIAKIEANPTFTGTVTLPSTTSIGTVSSTEIGYVDGVTSAIQTQLDSKLTATTAVTSNRNVVINGDFKIWQRGTSYTVAPGNYGAADRYIYWHNGSTNGTNTVSRQTFTPGDAPVAGYESEFFQRITTTTLGTGQTVIDTWQKVENVRTLAGQAVTVSFWAKTSGTFTVRSILGQNFGSGGSSSVDTNSTSATATSGSWTRYTGTVTLPSVSGKTIGSNSYVNMIIRFSSPTAGATFDIWGVQLEAGAVATPFEFEDIGTTLAKCQRYYYRLQPNAVSKSLSFGSNYSTNNSRSATMFPVEMRIAPTALEQSGTANQYAIAQAGINQVTCSSVPSFSNATTRFATMTFAATGLLTQFNPISGNTDATNGATAYLAWSAELQ